MAASYAKRANSIELRTSLSTCEHLESSIARARETTGTLKGQRAGYETRNALHFESASDKSSSHIRSRQMLLDEHSRYQLELGEARSEHEGAVTALESEVRRIDDECSGPKADVAEAAVLYQEQLSQFNTLEADAHDMESHRIDTLHKYNSELRELAAELEEERKRAQRRGRRAVAQGQKVLATAKGKAEEEESRLVQAQDEATSAATTEERRLRTALGKTMRQLEGHRARNLTTEEAIARSLTEKEVHGESLKEITLDLEKLQSEHATMTSELKEVRADRTALKRSQDVAPEVSELRAAARVLAGEEKLEQELCAKDIRSHRQEIEERTRTIASYKERLEKARTCSDKAAEILLQGFSRAKAEVAAASTSAAAVGCRPVVGDAVIILDTPNSRAQRPAGIGKEFIVQRDDGALVPYLIDSAWFYADDVRLPRQAFDFEELARTEMNEALRQYTSEQHLAKLLLTGEGLAPQQAASS